MGLLDRLFGRDSDEDEGETAEMPEIAEEFTVSEGSRGWLNIEYSGELFHVKRTDSPNGEYTGAYRDGVQGGTEPEPGRVFLMEDEELSFTRTIDRPNGCAVANDGTVAVADWGLEWGQNLSGTFHVFDSEGDRLLEHEFDANIEPVAVTADGRYAATSTGDPDRSTYVFDVEAGKLVLKHRTPDGPVTRLTFLDGSDGGSEAAGDAEWLLELGAPDREPERITLDGETV